VCLGESGIPRTCRLLSADRLLGRMQAAEEEIIECISDSLGTITPLLPPGSGVLRSVAFDVDGQLLRLRKVHASVTRGYTKLHRHALSLNDRLDEVREWGDRRVVVLFLRSRDRRIESKSWLLWLASTCDGIRSVMSEFDAEVDSGKRTERKKSSVPGAGGAPRGGGVGVGAPECQKPLPKKMSF